MPARKEFCADSTAAVLGSLLAEGLAFAAGLARPPAPVESALGTRRLTSCNARESFSADVCARTVGATIAIKRITKQIWTLNFISTLLVRTLIEAGVGALGFPVEPITDAAQPISKLCQTPG